jgi:L-histidine N-alpha-methyltransferase
MIPNLEPDNILPKLAQLVRKDDLLLMSANLAPGGDYLAGVKRVLPGYDNAQTRAWLLAFLYDLGVEAGDGAVDFSIEENSGLYSDRGGFSLSS